MQPPKIDPTKYQVFLCTCPTGIFSGGLFAHTWFVVNDKGTLSRWEVFHIPDLPPLAGDTPATFRSWGHLYRDYLPPFQGFDMFSIRRNTFRWKGRVIDIVEGGDDSLAAQMAACIKQSPDTYPLCYTYRFSRLNCNTYTQWVIDQFPQCKLRLPWNAFRKRLASSDR